MLLVQVEATGFSRVWMGFNEKVLKADTRELLCEADVRVACVALDTGKPRRLPEDMMEILQNTQ